MFTPQCMLTHGHLFGGEGPITMAAITVAVDIIIAAAAVTAGIMDIEHRRAYRISPLMGWTGLV